ncbi:hypothetical protein [Terrabacter sp. Root181]|uniref:hypothetical protein n=1 Tax=Terrabacter sp. Root181 TaxID=1736484 RepID=UPI0006F21E7F|nr:hypothetical protein [Terrabacter sp. Root181]KRB44271.1 hypothetical protein ASD90_17925 [Terrabacter sp. Root181]
MSYTTSPAWARVASPALDAAETALTEARLANRAAAEERARVFSEDIAPVLTQRKISMPEARAYGVDLSALDAADRAARQAERAADAAEEAVTALAADPEVQAAVQAAALPVIDEAQANVVAAASAFTEALDARDAAMGAAWRGYEQAHPSHWMHGRHGWNTKSLVLDGVRAMVAHFPEDMPAYVSAREAARKAEAALRLKRFAAVDVEAQATVTPAAQIRARKAAKA